MGLSKKLSIELECKKGYKRMLQLGTMGSSSSMSPPVETKEVVEQETMAWQLFRHRQMTLLLEVLTTEQPAVVARGR